MGRRRRRTSGSWPVAVSVAVVTSDGGRISSKASALRSRASWHSARTSVAPGPRSMREHRARRSSRARSRSRMPSCGADLPVRHALVLAVARRGRSRRPARPGCRLAGAVGRVGARACSGCAAAGRAARRRRRRPRRRAACSCSPSARLSAWRASASSPRRRAAAPPTCFDSSLTCRAQRRRARCSARGPARRARRPRSSCAEVDRPRRARSAFTPSRSVRSAGRRSRRPTVVAVAASGAPYRHQ